VRRTPGLAAAALVALLIAPPPAHAADWPSAARGVFARVVFDPTTYGPAITSYTAERLDWHSSQVFFQHGYLEHNPQFTVSGFADDVPVGYAAGKRIILRNSLEDLAASLTNNVAAAIIERTFIGRHPRREKLIRTIGWIERISFAVALASGESAKHFRQWRDNVDRARQLDYR
jgi:hypothetical protein